MNYEDFLSYVQEAIVERVDPSAKVELHKVMKNNNMELDGISIMKPNNNISPTLYLNDYYEAYVEGQNLKEIVDEILTLYESHEDEIPFDIEAFKSYERMKERIAYKLINFESNIKLLEDVPYQRILDLAIVFFVVISSDSRGTSTILIHYEHLDLWNITEKQLFEDAKINTPLLFKEDLQDIEEIIGEYMSDLEPVPIDKPKMYVLTNEDRINGAATLLYDNLLSAFADQVKQNLYILPSSIHEVILVPDCPGVTQKDLEKMVIEVNASEVLESDRLSNHVYFFDRRKKVLCM